MEKFDPSNSDHVDLLQMIQSDVQFYRATTGNGCDDHSLRRLSASLRLLVADGMISRAWKLLERPKYPIIPAFRLRTEHLPPSTIATASGSMTRGVQVAGVAFHNQAVTPEEIKKHYEEGKADMDYPFPFHEFNRSCSVFYKGTKVTREQVIRYVADKKGGTHFDPSRGDKKRDEAYKVLDKCADDFSFMSVDESKRQNIVYNALLSIAQAIAQSPDIQSMCTEIDDHVL